MIWVKIFTDSTFLELRVFNVRRGFEVTDLNWMLRLPLEHGLIGISGNV